MNELDKLREIRQSVSKARESCAGSNIKDLNDLKDYTVDSWYTARRFGMFDIGSKLSEIFTILLDVKEYNDRLKPDNLFCDILNDLDEKIRELEQHG